MKKVSLYEFKDLDKEVQEQVIVQERETEVDFQLEMLAQSLNQDLMTEEDYYNTIGCSKSYAKQTSWFVPSCYYEHNQELVEENVDKQVKAGLYTKTGKWVQPIK